MAEAQRAVGTEALPGGDLPIETLLQLSPLHDVPNVV